MSLNISPEIANYYLMLIDTKNIIPDKNRMFTVVDNDGKINIVFKGTIDEIAKESQHKYQLNELKNKQASLEFVKIEVNQDREMLLSEIEDVKNTIDRIYIKLTK